MKGPRNRLKALRAERDLSQLDLSTKTGIKEYRYWRIENGYVVPTDRERLLIARVLRVSENEVFPESIAS
jgi:transcriptional regulator with XRE-family HTH domain